MQIIRTLQENLADLPQGCDWSGKRDSKGKTNDWSGCKLHLTIGVGGFPLAAILISASVHDSQAAIPLMQMSLERATILYDLADSACNAEEIKAESKKLGHVSIIDPDPRRGEAIELFPEQHVRYQQLSTIERTNSD